MIKKILVSIFFVTLSINSCFADQYFPANEISPNSIKKPLDRNEDKYRDEVNQIILLQKNADPKDIEKSNNEIDLIAENISIAVDPNLRREDFPKLYVLLDNSLETTIAVTENFKKYWNMKRPYLSDSRIKSMVKTSSKNPSYPSGLLQPASLMLKFWRV